ncbi:Hypothetical_protein [Hexamita inflata]|uniref:Hypothetical_protein n=1 Tax=Hexamita inflata TaxID=28002 RepID=A0AA86TKV5_9EUKA|nr:Hypothetical protein HINF_LOCUS7946 [Hexamita inflata]CAI9920302.1 Hypothetical protein HINF_LOCUS7947 [Hexamita inflata]CAI9920303.1 Hypothetical protein HINF_LOCUS7948 [Hexamita inflata]CAI9920305.1 Hypothetical protein HINF_LOCUS7950 [Hexamita inflata]CAI9920306.1 Hypothetical protein HINF_LOCUS7951 [Hexamita inflata]
MNASILQKYSDISAFTTNPCDQSQILLVPSITGSRTYVSKRNRKNEKEAQVKLDFEGVVLKVCFKTHVQTEVVKLHLKRFINFKLLELIDAGTHLLSLTIFQTIGVVSNKSVIYLLQVIVKISPTCLI